MSFNRQKIWLLVAFLTIACSSRLLVPKTPILSGDGEIHLHDFKRDWDLNETIPPEARRLALDGISLGMTRQQVARRVDKKSGESPCVEYSAMGTVKSVSGKRLTLDDSVVLEAGQDLERAFLIGHQAPYNSCGYNISRSAVRLLSGTRIVASAYSADNIRAIWGEQVLERFRVEYPHLGTIDNITLSPDSLETEEPNPRLELFRKQLNYF